MSRLAPRIAGKVRNDLPTELRMKPVSFKSTFRESTLSAIVRSRGAGPLPFRFFGARSFFVLTIVNDPLGDDIAAENNERLCIFEPTHFVVWHAENGIADE